MSFAILTPELLLLGALAGFTIFLGLPVAILSTVSAKVKGFLNAITIGVLIFILIEVLPQAKANAESALLASPAQGGSYILALILGLILGMFGLVLYEMRFIRIRQRRALTSANPGALGQAAENKTERITLGLGEAAARGSTMLKKAESGSTTSFPFAEAKQIALSIAIGIGVHNFSEGLAIGQAFASSIFSLSFLLIIGFAIHNATEGFGISAPLAGFRPQLSYLALLGFIGGVPTLLGTVVGAVWPASPLALTFFLALAAGALIYIISGMFYVARRQTSNELFMVGLFLGFLVAYATDLYLVLLGAAI